ncbi:MAG: Stp1/IreP family PP2C-type Ser/Thr phosphatase [Actinobacteria bacterium]|nr:Stp1/IreP family PP2C-type Ser/Thr phosphatase [Actinomycetota bacterium]
MEYYANSDTGNYRKQNEDYYYISEKLFIVADGMGGHNAGEIASKTAVEEFVRYFNSNSGPEIESGDDKPIEKLLKASISHANNKVLDLAFSNPAYNGMGTTFTGCYITGEAKNAVLHIIHAGDSRVYLKSKSSFSLLTEDHTLVGKMYRDGLITYEEAFSHPLRNYLENVLGLEEGFTSDYIETGISINDIVLICSDGLNSMLKDAEINQIIVKYKKPGKITDELILKAKENGGLDNITAIIIKV